MTFKEEYDFIYAIVCHIIVNFFITSLGSSTVSQRGAVAAADRHVRLLGSQMLPPVLLWLMSCATALLYRAAALLLWLLGGIRLLRQLVHEDQSWWLIYKGIILPCLSC